MKKRAFGVAAVSLIALNGCGSGDEGGEDSNTEQQQGTGGTTGEVPDEPEPTTPGIHVADDEVIFRTDEYTLDPGQERFLCYAGTIDQDLVIDGYSHEGAPHLHHVIFSRATAPEPEGFSECDVLFRFSWEPLYLTGAGSSSIEFPSGVGHQIPLGTQIVSQLHLLNASTEPVSDALVVRMRRSTAENPRSMGSYVFGSLGVQLPPLQPSTLEGVCTLDETVEIVAAFPHMHYLGTALTFEVGPSEDAMSEVFRRDPYNFDDQRLELFELTLQPGDMTRVTCHYENPYNETITFGESTTNEMCFLIGMAADREGVNGCFFGGSGGEVGDPVPVDPAAGVCGEHEPTADGIGLPCTAGGNECPADLTCTAEYSPDGSGVCIRVGCETNADCGGTNVTCCSPAQTGGAVKLCTPEACRDPSCVPQTAAP